MKYFNTIVILLTLLVSFGCNDDDSNNNGDGDCIPKILLADFNIYKSNEKCSDLGDNVEVTFAAKFSFDYCVECDMDCPDKKVHYENPLAVVKHLNGTVDTFHFGTTAAPCNNDKSFVPFLILQNNVNGQNPIIYELGDTIVFQLSDATLCTVDKRGRCDREIEAVPLNLPDHTYEYILQPADFDCD